MPALLHSIAFLIALCVQSMSSPLAAAWLFFHFAGCAMLLKDGYPKHKGIVWYGCLAWLATVGASALLLKTVSNGAAFMWIVAAAPSLALCLSEKHLRSYIIAFGTCITLYALGLMLQSILGVHYTYYNFNGADGRSWPLLDPNNAALVLNIGLIPSFYLALKNWKWLLAVGFFTIAIAITHSKAGGLSAAAGCSLILAHKYRFKFILPAVHILSASVIYLHYFKPWILIGALESLAARLSIWEGCWPLLFKSPWIGTGIGTFGYYYAQTKVEVFTSGWWAHNDLIQFAIELGLPAALVFCFLIFAVVKTTRKKNIVSAAVLLAALVQAMLEFQLYVPVISLTLGLVLAYHSRRAYA